MLYGLGNNIKVSGTAYRVLQWALDAYITGLEETGAATRDVKENYPGIILLQPGSEFEGTMDRIDVEEPDAELVRQSEPNLLPLEVRDKNVSDVRLHSALR